MSCFAPLGLSKGDTDAFFRSPTLLKLYLFQPFLSRLGTFGNVKLSTLVFGLNDPLNLSFQRKRITNKEMQPDWLGI
jgi:hypothetical protein